MKSSKKNPVAATSSAVEKHGRDVIGRIIHAAAPYSPPYLIGASLWPVGDLAHDRFGGSPIAAAALTLADVALTGVSWEATSKRSPKTRLHAVITTGAASGWLTVAAITGVHHGLLDAYLLGGTAVATSWAIRRGARNTGTDEDGEGDGLWEKVKLAKTKLRHAKVEPNRVEAELQLPPGELTHKDVAKAKENLASALSVPINGVRVAAHPDHADRAHLTVVPKDLLRTPPQWPGPSAPGATMVAPLVIGLHEDGLDARLYAAADPKADRNLSHLGLAGTSGSGKGVIARNLIAEIATRRECSVWAIDVVKRRQTLGCAAGLFDWFATSRDQAAAMLDCLPEVIAARTDVLGSRGLDNWVPGCGLNFLTVWIEEAAAVIRDDQQFVDILAAARSAGVWFVISAQRWTFDNIPTSVRANVNGFVCCGTRDGDDAVVVLGEEMVAAGADPSVWKNQMPGYCYLTAPGTPKERQLVPARSFGAPFKDDPAKLTDVIDQYTHLRDPLDPITVAAAGTAYTTRTDSQNTPPDQDEHHSGEARERTATLIAMPTRASEQPVVPVAEPPVLTAGVPVVEAHTEEVPEEVRRQLPDPPLPDSPEPDVHATALGVGEDQALPDHGGTPWQFGPEPETQPDRDYTPEQARQALREAIAALAAAGATEITAPDLAELLATVDRGRTWLVGELRALTEARVLERIGTGVYRIRAQAAKRELAGV